MPFVYIVGILTQKNAKERKENGEMKLDNENKKVSLLSRSHFCPYYAIIPAYVGLAAYRAKTVPLSSAILKPKNSLGCCLSPNLWLCRSALF